MIKMYKNLQFHSLKNIIYNKRSLWKWIDDTFNRVDDDRIKEVGPNMACAEWLMKNGAQVKWRGCKEFVSHYDCLPRTKCALPEKFQIEQVYAGKEASISHIGFLYFKNCNNISDVAFVGCHTINNTALNKLQFLKESITHLEINGCINVSDNGIFALEHLQILKHLDLKNLQLKNQPEAISYLKTKLPKCNIMYEEQG